MEEKHFVEKDGKKICYFGVIDNYVWFKKTRYTKKYKFYILKNIREVYNQLLDKYNYLYTFSYNRKDLNKWHSFIGMIMQEQFIYKNKTINIWVNKWL
ncbi:hypothetical protein J5751_04875 [bacterium]|nr:hypothetical protein [bacterium]